MSFIYTTGFIESGFSYHAYRAVINEALALEPVDEAASKMRHYISKNVVMMQRYDESYKVSAALKATVEAGPTVTWLIISEGWCGDAAFNVPMMAAIENLIPQKVKLKLFFRDSNLPLIDANLTDGGRSIPKLIALNSELNVIGHWGPRPEPLQVLMKDWKAHGLGLKELIPLVHEWYDNDDTQTLQQELIAMIKSYS